MKMLDKSESSASSRMVFIVDHDVNNDTNNLKSSAYTFSEEPHAYISGDLREAMISVE
jgi:hypothetical protein